MSEYCVIPEIDPDFKQANAPFGVKWDAENEERSLSLYPGDGECVLRYKRGDFVTDIRLSDSAAQATIIMLSKHLETDT